MIPVRGGASTDARAEAPSPTVRPSARVVVFPGSNGDRDLYEALSQAGFAVDYHDARQAVSRDVDLVGLPGGFSYGDYWRAGMLASRAAAVQSLSQVIAARGLVIGICNGFQILIEAGYLPGALTYNSPPRFLHAWVDVQVTAAAHAVRSPWFCGLPAGKRMRLPIAHAEGCYVPPAGVSSPGIPLVYCRNPNGSFADAAALLDDTGRVLGIMPHPERAADITLGSDSGAALFRAAFAYASARAQRTVSARRVEAPC